MVHGRGRLLLVKGGAERGQCFRRRWPAVGLKVLGPLAAGCVVVQTGGGGKGGSHTGPHTSKEVSCSKFLKENTVNVEVKKVLLRRVLRDWRVHRSKLFSQ